MTETEQSNPLDIFPSQVQKDVEGLRDLGYLEDEFVFCGHHFTIRTLRGNEELRAAKLTDEFLDSVGRGKAWAWAHVALALITVDYRDDFCPAIGPDPDAYAKGRFNYVTSNWFWPLGEYIFSRYADLQVRQTEAVEALRSLLDRSLPTAWPSAGFSTEQGSSDEQIDGESQPSAESSTSLPLS